MNGFDFALIAIVALSTLFAFARGVVREVIALATWAVAYKSGFTRGDNSAVCFAFAGVAPFLIVDAPDASPKRRALAHAGRLGHLHASFVRRQGCWRRGHPLGTAPCR